MNNFNLVITLGVGSLLAFLFYFIFFKVLHWGGKVSALATAAIMLLIYVPLAVTHWAGLDVFAIHFAFFMMIPYGLGIIMGVHDERRDREGTSELKKGMHWIPALIIIFFILLAVVDSVIISFATGGLGSNLAKIILPESISEDIGSDISSRFTGAISNDFQDEEVEFDKHVAKLKKQRERGWKITGGWNKTPEVNKLSTFTLVAKDKSGNYIDDAIVSVEFRRASDMSHDQKGQLKEVSNGTYSEDFQLPLAGCWGIKIVISKGDDEHEIRGETEISTMIDGKLVTPECAEGEPDVEQKRTR
jgi:nitrogen fixation protein FixH